ncbi:hypothetical protein [Cellulomonas sp. Leaf334]|uniref:hypothetical protein n=1 Tax=Cellulomonas sp. Leaf334 TaxID=1736339 RepID=UPI0006FB4254|nr:hypothetical protein [Cellulomonas sp. Leaf334]KQR10973.1 hypothetical protein ASF78_14930 [Cellulomonas sp. Leaf334]
MTEVQEGAPSSDGVLTLARPVPRFSPADAVLWVVLATLVGGVLAIVAGVVVTPAVGIVVGLAVLVVVVAILRDGWSRSSNPTFRAVRPRDVVPGHWVVLAGSRTQVARVRSVHADRLVLEAGRTVRSEQTGRANHVWASPTPPPAGSSSAVAERDPSAGERVKAQRDERRRARRAESDGTGDVYNDGGSAGD